MTSGYDCVAGVVTGGCVVGFTVGGRAIVVGWWTGGFPARRYTRNVMTVARRVADGCPVAY